MNNFEPDLMKPEDYIKKAFTNKRRPLQIDLTACAIVLGLVIFSGIMTVCICIVIR